MPERRRVVRIYGMSIGADRKTPLPRIFDPWSTCIATQKNGRQPALHAEAANGTASGTNTALWAIGSTRAAQDTAQRYLWVE